MTRKSCRDCRRLHAIWDTQEARLEAFEATVAHFESQLAAVRKDSSTYSKSPSADIVHPMNLIRVALSLSDLLGFPEGEVRMAQIADLGRGDREVFQRLEDAVPIP